MKKFFLILVFFWVILPNVFSAEELAKVTKTYEEYQQNSKNQCDASHNPWSENNSLVPIPQYPKLDTQAVNNKINSPNLENISDGEKEQLQQELNMQRIGEFSGFKTLEVARLQYRSTMNSLFACAIVESRLKILSDLRANFTELSSEINQQFDKEQKKLEEQKSKLNCQSAKDKTSTSMQELVNSSTRQYCHYRHYLSYLDDHLRADRYNIEQIEKGIGMGSGTKSPSTVLAWLDSYNSYVSGLETEITRAETTLPRVLKSYKEMERAYPVHLLLMIIYDDYIRLRKNLSSYMNASTQLYIKAYNAQDANQR